MIEILLRNGHVLEDMVLRLGRNRADPEVFVLGLEKVLSMPRSSPCAKVIDNSILVSHLILYCNIFSGRYEMYICNEFVIGMENE